MISWKSPRSFKSDWFAESELLELVLYETNSDSIASRSLPTGSLEIYVCGITPYDSAHLGHAFTYTIFDVLVRFLRQSGRQVNYVQNITDVDDPLFDRARRDNLPWKEIAVQQINKFVHDMEVISVGPPNHFIAVSDAMESVQSNIEILKQKDAIYQIEDDWYFDSSGYSYFLTSSFPEKDLRNVFEQRGGDPNREGKRNPLDPVVWKKSLSDEPQWQCEIGAGRPGWHIECVAIINEYLSLPLFVQGGGKDLIFPHHTMCAHQIEKITGKNLAENYLHVGMVEYQGEKMSKSLGNLVFVSELIDQGYHPGAVRLSLLDNQWHEDWEWSPKDIEQAQIRIKKWKNTLPKVLVTSEIKGLIFNDLSDNLNMKNIFVMLDELIPDEIKPPALEESVAALIFDVLGIEL